jgi:hypothetical protein
MLSADVCKLPATGGSTFVLVAALFMLVAGVIVSRWVRQSAGRMSVVVAPLVLLGGLVLAPSVTDPCAPTTTTLAPALYQVGDSGPTGGTIFYVDMARAVGSQYFEAACGGWSDGTCGGLDYTDPIAAWGCRGSDIMGADGVEIGSGEQNTADIVDLATGCPEAGTAAKLADTLVLGGQDDWFLPSKDELNQMYEERNKIGGFFPFVYWSSFESSDYNSWYQGFGDGGQYDDSKSYPHYVRPIRAF